MNSATVTFRNGTILIESSDEVTSCTVKIDSKEITLKNCAAAMGVANGTVGHSQHLCKQLAVHRTLSHVLLICNDSVSIKMLVKKAKKLFTKMFEYIHAQELIQLENRIRASVKYSIIAKNMIVTKDRAYFKLIVTDINERIVFEKSEIFISRQSMGNEIISIRNQDNIEYRIASIDNSYVLRGFLGDPTIIDFNLTTKSVDILLTTITEKFKQNDECEQTQTAEPSVAYCVNVLQESEDDEWTCSDSSD